MSGVFMSASAPLGPRREMAAHSTQRAFQTTSDVLGRQIAQIKDYQKQHPITLSQRIYHWMSGGGWISRKNVAAELGNQFINLKGMLTLIRTDEERDFIRSGISDLRNALTQLKGMGVSHDTTVSIEAIESGLNSLELNINSLEMGGVEEILKTRVLEAMRECIAQARSVKRTAHGHENESYLEYSLGRGLATRSEDNAFLDVIESLDYTEIPIEELLQNAQQVYELIITGMTQETGERSRTSEIPEEAQTRLTQLKESIDQLKRFIRTSHL